MEYDPCTECRHGPDCAGCAYHEERAKRVRTDVEVARLREESAEAFVEFMIAKFPRLACRSKPYRDTLLEFRESLRKE